MDKMNSVISFMTSSSYIFYCLIFVALLAGMIIYKKTGRNNDTLDESDHQKEDAPLPKNVPNNMLLKLTKPFLFLVFIITFICLMEVICYYLLDDNQYDLSHYIKVLDEFTIANESNKEALSPHYLKVQSDAPLTLDINISAEILDGNDTLLETVKTSYKGLNPRSAAIITISPGKSTSDDVHYSYKLTAHKSSLYFGINNELLQTSEKTASEFALSIKAKDDNNIVLPFAFIREQVVFYRDGKVVSIQTNKSLLNTNKIRSDRFSVSDVYDSAEHYVTSYVPKVNQFILDVLDSESELHTWNIWIFVVITIICIIAILSSFLKNPYEYPYFEYYFNVSGKRKPSVYDQIDEYLIKYGFDEIEEHEKSIYEWKKACEQDIQQRFFVTHRWKQYQSILDDTHAYSFVMERSQRRYRQVNYVRHAYDVMMTDKEYTCDYSFLLNRYHQLSEIDFECTLSQYHSKKQRSLMTSDLRRSIMERDHYTCQICGKYMPDEVGLHIDHIVSIKNGGKSVPSNLQVLCDKCNYSKGSKKSHNLPFSDSSFL